MTKQDFEKIAKMLKDQKKLIQGLNNKDFKDEYIRTKIIISNIENDLIRIFIDDNPRFDVGKFVKASNLTQAEMRLPLWEDR